MLEMSTNNYFIVVFSLLILHVSSISCAERQVYIVYLGEHSGTKTFHEIEDSHHSYLHSVKGSKEEAKRCIIYSYKKAINGFSALLYPEEADLISDMDGVISVFHSHPTKYRLHTTRSWDFINLLESNWDPAHVNGEEVLSKAGYGKDVIVGVLDSGIWPESASFSDEGMEPIPRIWNGTCEEGIDFNSSHCNRKLIGARYYLKGYEAYYGPLNPRTDFRSARDSNGHGTHTSSTIGGRRVANAAAIGGFGNGTASGGAPLVRLAIYKVCWQVPNEIVAVGSTCMDADMLAAFDDAITDGVHVISVSIGGNHGPVPYYEDGIAIGALHAAKRDIVTACSAGNDGPDFGTVSNIAPWFITVGASSIDRVFSSPVVLENGIVLQGQSITPFQKGTYPLVYAGNVEIPGTTTSKTTGRCLNGTLSASLVQGKAVFCWVGDLFESLEVERAGGVATILGNPYNGIEVDGRPFLIPGTTILRNEAYILFNYTQTSQRSSATLIPARTLIGTDVLAPFMARFTSRGPNLIEGNILKPDITAPGLNILAAWSEAASPLNVPSDNRIAKFQIVSGTSMSCPHVSAAAALVKAIHPDWSSAAIRSALMTTATVTNNAGNPITDAIGNLASPFQYGAGHIQPSKAADPGLVYDASYTDYLLFLCNNRSVAYDPSFICPRDVPPPSNLNYPSLSIFGLVGSLTVTRTVTNVGIGKSSYNLRVDPPRGFLVEIIPKTLHFSSLGEKQTFDVTITARTNSLRGYAFGSYSWSDGIHLVTSPITVYMA